MKIVAAVAALILFFAAGAKAETTNALSDAEIQGQALAQRILEQQPASNLTNTGTMEIRKDGTRSKIPIQCATIVTGTNWEIIYSDKFLIDAQDRSIEVLIVVHNPGAPNQYLYTPEGQPTLAKFTIDGTNGLEEVLQPKPKPVSERNLETFYFGAPMTSDFSFADLGLEFFHWPEQKVLKQEIHRSCGCTVLESTNPDPSANGYSRVVSWIDNDTLGIVEAYAYDAKGKLLKDFYPKDFKKINGQWQVQTLVMENVQTGSRSRLEFDLKK